jgi:RNA polymerase sigma factor (sigma-70 family)
MSLKETVNKLIFFHHESFDDRKCQTTITAEIPEYQKFLDEAVNISIKKSKVPSDVKIFYESPLLSLEQEQHLFRKMNYLKYKARCLFKNKENGKKITKLLDEAEEIRNQIARANFRLITPVVKKIRRDGEDFALLISEFCFSILRSVECFDWRKGVKFSTYATWSIKHCYANELKRRKQKKNSYIVDSINFDNMEIAPEVDIDQLQIEQKNKSAIQYALGKLRERNEKYAKIIEIYYGINCESKPLEQIGQEFGGVTKERIRQIRNKSLGIMKKMLERNVVV